MSIDSVDKKTKLTDGTDVALITATGELNVIATAQPGVDIGDVTLNNATLAVTQSGVWDEVGINDSGNSITVDNAQLSVVGSGTEAAAMRVTIATDSTGLISVDDNGSSLTVDNGGTFVTQENGAALTALQLIDDVVHSGDAVLSKYAVMGAVFDDTATVAVTENQAQSLRMSTRRALLVEGVASGTAQPVSGTVTANLAAGTNNIGDVDILTIAAGDNNIGNVDIVTLPASTNTLEVVGDVAEDAALAGNPVRQGVRASTVIPTAMSADGDVVTPWANRNGAQVVTQAPHVGRNSDPWNLVHETAQYTTTQTTTVLVAGGASEKLVVNHVQIQVGGTTAGTLQLFFGTAAYSRGTSRAIFDGEFVPSATQKPVVIMNGPWIAGTNGDDLLVTTSAAINPLTITVWYYVVT